jgi:glycosyltransferase involved in cell wall biosynthesis
MNLVFVSSGQYPNGGAATNRHMAYAKGLSEAGHSVTFLLLARQISGNNESNNSGINFTCTFPEGYNSNATKYRKLLFHIQSLRARKQTIVRLNSKSKIDCIILLDTVVWILIPLIQLAKKHKIKVFHERTEYPFVVGNKGLIGKINLKIYLSLVINQFSGIYVISQAIKNYFNERLNNKIPIEIINMIVDPDRFKSATSGGYSKDPYIAYCGALNDDKDGVDILIEAFGDALANGKISNNIKLMLIGEAKNESFQNKLEEIIDAKKCRNNIIFTGKVERFKVPGLLNEAAAHALARPDSKQAEGGFPTKLGEYLATGKPVIITDVGEIGNFLKDGYNAFIAKPGDVSSFSGKISEVFSDYDKGIEVGKRGQLLVYNEFNYYEQAEKLARFIEFAELGGYRKRK